MSFGSGGLPSFLSFILIFFEFIEKNLFYILINLCSFFLLFFKFLWGINLSTKCSTRSSLVCLSCHFNTLWDSHTKLEFCMWAYPDKWIVHMWHFAHRISLCNPVEGTREVCPSWIHHQCHHLICIWCLPGALVAVGDSCSLSLAVGREETKKISSSKNTSDVKQSLSLIFISFGCTNRFSFNFQKFWIVCIYPPPQLQTGCNIWSILEWSFPSSRLVAIPRPYLPYYLPIARLPSWLEL